MDWELWDWRLCNHANKGYIPVSICPPQPNFFRSHVHTHIAFLLLHLISTKRLQWILSIPSTRTASDSRALESCSNWLCVPLLVFLHYILNQVRVTCCSTCLSGKKIKLLLKSADVATYKHGSNYWPKSPQFMNKEAIKKMADPCTWC